MAQIIDFISYKQNKQGISYKSVNPLDGETNILNTNDIQSNNALIDWLYDAGIIGYNSEDIIE